MTLPGKGPQLIPGSLQQWSSNTSFCPRDTLCFTHCSREGWVWVKPCSGHGQEMDAAAAVPKMWIPATVTTSPWDSGRAFSRKPLVLPDL